MRARILFDAGRSRDNVGIARFLWDFSDGSSVEGVKVTHTYGKAGVYNVTLTVEDAKGNKAMDFVIATVQEAPAFQLPSFIVGIILFAAALFIVWFFFRRR